MAIKRQRIVADFETTTDENDVRVWAVCAVDIDTGDVVHLGNNIADFIEWLSDLNTVCYFHNLKFDISFVLDYLMKEKGFKYSTSHEAGTIETLITDRGVFYSVTAYFAKKNKTYKKCVFYDSLKKLPFSVSAISKAFALKDEKLTIDYNAPRPVGHVLTAEERAYVINDCRIVAEALRIQMAEGLTKMTIASDAINEYKTVISKNQFDYLYPTFPIEMDDDIRRAYKGGFVWLKPEHQNKRGLEGITLDVNSLYPSVMYNCLLPFGYPRYFEGEPEEDKKYPLFIVRMRCAFELKPDHIPTIQLKNNRWYVETEYLTSSRAKGEDHLKIVELTLTNVDLQLFKDHYNLYNVEYIGGWRFRGAKGLFTEFIDKWMAVKENNTGPKRTIAKLVMNSSYGKFATSVKGGKKVPYVEDDVIKYKDADPADEKHPRQPVYTAMGAFITAYAREKTIRSAQNVYDRFIYADTDSLHLIGTEPPEGLDVHPTRLGAWKNEGVFTDSKYIRAKTYMETVYTVHKDTLENYCILMQGAEWVRREPDGIHCGLAKVTCAGMPANVKKYVTYDNFHPGSTFEGKLMPKRVPGGMILKETTFTIK